MRQVVALVVAALWLGAALITVTVVAPGAFAVLPTRAMAGDMVGSVLPWVFRSAIVVHFAVPYIAPALRRRTVVMAATMVAAFASVSALLFVDPRIAAIRAAAVVPIDQLPPADPRRTLFGLLHGVSVALLGLAMLANAAMLASIAKSVGARPTDQ